jgi:hypothetical protein
MQGRSLRPLLAGQEETRDVAYSEWHVHPSRCGVGLKLRTVRTRTHKCTFELDSGAGELYDLVHDPEEMVNRFNDPGYVRIRKELEDMMRAPRRDLGPVPRAGRHGVMPGDQEKGVTSPCWGEARSLSTLPWTKRFFLRNCLTTPPPAPAPFRHGGARTSSP